MATFGGFKKGFLNRTRCPICIVDIQKSLMITTRCGHTFCESCFEKWEKAHNTCPMCRSLISKPIKNIEKNIYIPTNNENIYNYEGYPTTYI